MYKKNFLLSTGSRSLILFVVVTTGSFTACDFESPAEKFDKKTGQEPVYTIEKMDSILSTFESVSFSELPDEYLVYTDPNGTFNKKLKDKKYRIVQGEECFLYIVGKNRIQNFLCTDKYFIENEKNIEANKKLYWLIDRQLLVWILEFMDELKSRDYNRDGFEVRESYRHAYYNEERGGATQSQHIFGTAADLTIKDINGDGKENETDKEIALEILETLVGDKGGMGLYPGTMTIHIDTRGFRARWNSYKRPDKK